MILRAALTLLTLTIPAMAQTTIKVDVLDAGIVCPGDHFTQETAEAPGTARGTTGFQRGDISIDISTDVVVYTRDVSFGPEVVLRGTALHQDIYVEVDRPGFGGSRLTEHYTGTLYPDDPRILLFTFSNVSSRLFGYWEIRVFFRGELMVTHSFHVVTVTDMPDLLAPCNAVEIVS